MSDLIDRIERSVGVPDLTDLLARLTPTDAQSLLLEAARRRARTRTPAQVLQAYQRDRFVRPAAAPVDLLLAWERTLHAALPPEVETLALSPVCPLGTCSSVAPVDPNWAVATVRTTEVVSDLTNVLALEAALRRREQLRERAKSMAEVHLAAGHRVLRGQRFTGPHQVQHFALFGLVSAARDRGTLGVELGALQRHLRAYLTALRVFLDEPPVLRLRVTDLAEQDRSAQLETLLLTPLREAFPGIDAGLDPERTNGRGYYREVCVGIDAVAPSGEWVNLVDGGAVDWTARLLSDAKERLVISGIGSERVCTLFRPEDA